MDKRALALVGVAALGIVGAATYRQFGGHPALAQGAAPTAPAQTQPASRVAVEVAPVRAATVVEEIGAVGSLQANESVVIAPEIEGRVSQILLEEGRKAEAGQILIHLDDSILRAELAQAQANLTLAQANYERSHTLFQQRSGTQRARDEALAALQLARAANDLARTRLDKATIRAPFAGILGLRSVGPGEFVTRGEALVTIQSLDPLKVDFRVPETMLSSIRTGQSIRVTADAIPDRSFTGEIYAIDPQVDVNGRAIRVRALIPNKDDDLRPGLFVRVAITAARRENALLVPEGAIVAQGERRLVYRVVDGKAQAVAVRIGQRRAGEVEVLEGITAADTVVTAGQQRLRNGLPVEIVNSTPRV